MKKKKQQKAQMGARIICWLVIPLILGAVLLMDYFGIYMITTERKTLVVILIAAILLPVTSEVKIGELSLGSKDKK